MCFFVCFWWGKFHLCDWSLWLDTAQCKVISQEWIHEMDEKLTSSLKADQANFGFFSFSLSVCGERTSLWGSMHLCAHGSLRWMVRINPQWCFTLLKLQDFPDRTRAYDVALITSLLALGISYPCFLRYRKAVLPIWHLDKLLVVWTWVFYACTASVLTTEASDVHFYVDLSI